MKKASIQFWISLCLAALLFTCNSGKEGGHSDSHHSEDKSSDTEVWKEMDEFHLVMAESFHPFMDSANLAPAKLQAEEMARVAAKWAAAPLPEKVSNAEVKAHLDNLKTSSLEFVTIVQKGNDEEIGKALTDLHHLFHEIQNAWYGHGKDDHAGHDHEH